MPGSRMTLTAMISILAATVGCASGQPSINQTQSAPDFVTSVEISATSANSAYDLVSRLRPNWLRPGGISSMAGGRITGQVTLVYLDGNKMGEIDVLKSISASGIQTMRWLDAVRAQTVLRGIGTEAIDGAIVLTTTR